MAHSQDRLYFILAQSHLGYSVGRFLALPQPISGSWRAKCVARFIRFAASSNVLESFWNGAIVFSTSSSFVLQSYTHECTVAIDSSFSLLSREVL